MRKGDLAVLEALARGESVGSTRSCPGFPVNSYEPVSAILNGQPLLIDPALQWLIGLIHKHHRGYDQEGFI